VKHQSECSKQTHDAYILGAAVRIIAAALIAGDKLKGLMSEQRVQQLSEAAQSESKLQGISTPSSRAA